VLSHGCILQMGFIVENKDQFIKKLLNMTKEHESA
jgi:hypothetical protein